jgi:hypothetical protein
MTFSPLKVGSPANDLLRLNYIFNKAERELQGSPSDIRFVRMWHSDAISLSGNQIVHSSDDDTFPYGSYWYNQLAANGNRFRHKFMLKAGTYDFVIMANTHNNAPILEFEVDSVSIGSVDLYSAGETDKAQLVISNVVIATDGAHTLIGETTGKNGSSGDYIVRLYKYFFREA